MTQQQNINALAGDWGEHNRKERERFIEDCAFAKVVSTSDGPALLIGGSVIEIKSSFRDHVEWLAIALRSGSADTQDASS